MRESHWHGGRARSTKQPEWLYLSSPAPPRPALTSQEAALGGEGKRGDGPPPGIVSQHRLWQQAGPRSTPHTRGLECRRHATHCPWRPRGRR